MTYPTSAVLPDLDDAKLTSAPECPYPGCGYVESDAWEIDFGPCLDGDTVISCARCGKDFAVRRVVDVHYKTRPMDTPAPPAEEE